MGKSGSGISPDYTERLMEILLKGAVISDEKGLPAKAYLSSDGERTARQFLANLLRSDRPLSPAIRKGMADLIESENATERRWEFRFRRAGKPRHILTRGLRIAEFILSEVDNGAPVEAAVASARAKFRISSTSAYDAWSKYKGLAKVMAALS